VQSNNQLQPPSSFLIPTSTRTDVIEHERRPEPAAALVRHDVQPRVDDDAHQQQQLPEQLQPAAAVGAVGERLAAAHPRLSRSTRAAAAARQPDQPRHRRHAAARKPRPHDGEREERVLEPGLARANGRRAPRDAGARAGARRVNKAKVDVGSSPPLDLVSAQAEVAANQEQLIIAETSVKQAEDLLRVLIFDPTSRENWNVGSNRSIRRRSRRRRWTSRRRSRGRSPSGPTCSARARTSRTRRLGEKYAATSGCPTCALNASYQASGLGGTQVLRTGGFPGTIVGPGTITPFGTVLGQLFARDYPTWGVGLNVSYPIGRSSDEANYAPAKLEHSQSEQRLKSAESRAILQVRDAAWKIEMNAKRIESARASRELAEQRLDAERKRFEVGMSTSFLVIQAQRDLAQAKTNELSSILAYDLSLVAFDALQEAGPAGSAVASAAAGASAAQGGSPTTITIPVGAAAAGRAGGIPAIPGLPQQ
jgi:hypothetical protein